MRTIRILSESASVGKRLRDILYQDGFSDIALSDLRVSQLSCRNDILIIYAKTNITGLMQSLSDFGGSAILLLNPDSYAMHLDRARYIGIELLLMPVAPFMLLDAVRKVIS